MSGERLGAVTTIAWLPFGVIVDSATSVEIVVLDLFGAGGVRAENSAAHIKEEVNEVTP